jgi:hypothetical protein
MKTNARYRCNGLGSHEPFIYAAGDECPICEQRENRRKKESQKMDELIIRRDLLELASLAFLLLVGALARNGERPSAKADDPSTNKGKKEDNR